MPILVPLKPSFANDAEKTVWKSLKDSLPDDVYLFHGVRVTDNKNDKEADLVVLWPNKGIAFIEVKGGHITPASDGKFIQKSLRKKEPIDPVSQIHGAMYAIRDWIGHQTSLNYHSPQNFLVAFPNSFLASSYQSSKISRSQFIDKDDLANSADIVRQAIEVKTGYTVSPDADDCARIAHVLMASIIDVTDVAELAKVIDKRSEEIEQYITDNVKLLDFVCDVRRFHVQGTAGTGKTALAMAHAQRLKQQGLRVAFLCYSRGLALYIRHQTESLPRDERIDVVKTFHALGNEWGMHIPENAGDDFWDQTAINTFTNLAKNARDEDKFDAIIIDEAQDFGPHWWNVVEELLRPSDNAGIYAFGDSSQEIFGRSSGFELAYVPLRLQVNLRNCDPIAALSHNISREDTATIGIDGPNVFYVEMPEDATKYEFITAGDDMVEYLHEFYEARHIAMLTTKSRHPRHAELADVDKDNHLRTMWNSKETFYGTVSGFKGLERNCVVLVVDGFHPDMNVKETLYTGITRARDLLVIVAQKSVMNQVFDDATINSLDRIDLDNE